MIRLYTYWRSSAAYRVRIALNLKGIDHELVPTRLTANEHRGEAYLSTNPQGLVPALEHDGAVFTQSLAIIEYLDSVKASPRMFPEDPAARAHVAAMAQAVACDIHPLNNLRVMNYLRGELAQDADAVQAWYAHWIHAGFRALEAWAKEFSGGGRFLYGDAVTVADVCLVPQIYNARRFSIGLEDYPLLVGIDANLQSLPAVIAASPEQQPDCDRT